MLPIDIFILIVTAMAFGFAIGYYEGRKAK